MNKFKPGDKVVVIAGPQKGEKVRSLKNRVDSVFFRNFPVRIKNQHYDAKGIWYAGAKVCLRHANPEEIAAAEKPLRRGDLVQVQGYIGIVSSEGPDVDGDYTIALLTGEENTVAYERGINVKRVGSIRKKIKRIKKEMEGAV